MNACHINAGHAVTLGVAAALLFGMSLTSTSHGDELWRQAKAYTAAVNEIHDQAVKTLEDAQDALQSAQDDLAEAQADLEEASAETSGVLAEIADEAAEAVASAKTALAIAEAGLKVAEALTDVAAAGTAIGQGADYLISFCWDPICPLTTETGTYAYPTDAELDAYAEAVITSALDTTLTPADLDEVELILPGAGAAARDYMRAVTRCFAIALRGAGAFSAGNCPDVLLARDDLAIALDDFTLSIGPFASYLQTGETYFVDGDPDTVLAEAHLRLLTLEPFVPQYPDPPAVQAAIDLARSALELARATLLSVSAGAGTPYAETFDAYVAGSGISGQGSWTAWNDDPSLDAIVTAEVSRSPDHCLDVHGGADVVLASAGTETGIWALTAWQYIPADYASGAPGPFAGSSFILLSRYTPDEGHDPSDRSLQMNFDSNDGMLKVYYGNGMNTVDVPYVPETWTELRATIDLDADWVQVFYGGGAVIGYPWTGGILGDGLGDRDIAALQLFAGDASPIFYDDIRLERIGGAIEPRPLDGEGGVLPPLTVEAFLEFLDDAAMHGVDALPAIEVIAVDVMMLLEFGLYDGLPVLSPAVAAWDGLGDTGGEAALFGPDGVLRFSEVLTSAVENHWTRIDLAASPLVQGCLPPCPGDTDGSGAVDVDDLVAVILDWGTDGAAHHGDVDGNGIVDVDDLIEVIVGWGPCDA